VVALATPPWGSGAVDCFEVDDSAWDGIESAIRDGDWKLA
jgi:hypothetical protein